MIAMDNVGENILNDLALSVANLRYPSHETSSPQ